MKHRISLTATVLIVVLSWLCWGAAGIILLSVPFALAIRIEPSPALKPQPSTAE